MKQIQKTFFALGTVNSILIKYDESQESQVVNALDQIKLKVQRLDDLLSVFKKSSEVSQINIAAGKDLVLVSPETFLIISKSVDYSELSQGAFDITTRTLSKLWGIGSKETFIPNVNEVRKAKRFVNYKNIIFMENPKRIGLRKCGQAIDLGGIAKGYAADEARRIVIKHNIKDAIINFGGTIVVIGDEKRVGIQNPEKETGAAVGILKVKNQAVVTSGLYERYFIKDGKRYHHILSPSTGMPTNTGLCGISVIGNSAMELDALSTAVFILGMDAGTKLLEQCKIDGIFILESGEVFMTKGLKEKFSLPKKQEAKKYE